MAAEESAPRLVDETVDGLAEGVPRHALVLRALLVRSLSHHLG